MNGNYQETLNCYLLRNGEQEMIEISLARECDLEITINDEMHLRASCSPVDIKELVYGRLLTEGFIQKTDDVSSLEIKWEGDVVQAHVTAEKASKTHNYAVPGKIWNEDMIQTLHEYVVRDARSNRQMHSTHSCTLMKEQKIVCYKEDVGRHNAIDRAVGNVLLNGIDPSSCIMFFSGRVSKEAIRKAHGAGITVLCGKALPTAQAVKLACELGITLLHCSEKRGMLLF